MPKPWPSFNRKANRPSQEVLLSHGYPRENTFEMDDPKEMHAAEHAERTQTETTAPLHETSASTPLYRTYKRRWFGLVQLVLLNIVVSWDVSGTSNHAALGITSLANVFVVAHILSNRQYRRNLLLSHSHDHKLALNLLPLLLRRRSASLLLCHK